MYNAFAVTMQAKIKPLREPANRKGWGYFEYTAPGTPQQSGHVE